MERTKAAIVIDSNGIRSWDRRPGSPASLPTEATNREPISPKKVGIEFAFQNFSNWLKNNYTELLISIDGAIVAFE